MPPAAITTRGAALALLGGPAIDDAEFRTAAACFEMQGMRWKLSDVEVMLGGESYLGKGSSQADGKLLLELTRGGRQLRYAGTLFALAP